MKKFLILILFILSGFLPCKLYCEGAQKQSLETIERIIVPITPIETISTHHDEVELGDFIKFKVVKDIYKNDVLYIKKDTPIFGKVEFVHENGWAGDSAQIDFLKFQTMDINNKLIKFSYPLKLVGNDLRNNDIKDILARILIVVRGAEINILPESKTFNLFLN